MSIGSELASAAGRVGTDWFHAKTFVEHAIAFSDDALHVFAGVLIQLLVAGVLRRSVASWLPWLVVLVLELLNETIDLWIERWPDFATQLGESGKDILLTVVLPTVLLVASRKLPRVLVRRN